MPQPLLSTTELLLHIRAKTRVGAEALYDQYSKVLCLAIFRTLRDKDLTDVILEKTIRHIWDNAALYDEQRAPLLGWMLGIAKNLASQQIELIKPIMTDL